MTTVVITTNVLRLRPLKIVELNATTTATVQLQTGSLLEDSAGWLDLGLLGVVVEVEYIVTPSTEHAVSTVAVAAPTFGGIEYCVSFSSTCRWP